jgi:hypothetical protein
MAVKIKSDVFTVLNVCHERCWKPDARRVCVVDNAWLSNFRINAFQPKPTPGGQCFASSKVATNSLSNWSSGGLCRFPCWRAVCTANWSKSLANAYLAYYQSLSFWLRDANCCWSLTKSWEPSWFAGSHALFETSRTTYRYGLRESNRLQPDNWLLTTNTEPMRNCPIVAGWRQP